MTAHAASRQSRRTGVGAAGSAPTWRAIASSRARFVRGLRSPSSGRYRQVVRPPGSDAARLVLARRPEVALEARRLGLGAAARAVEGRGEGVDGPLGRLVLVEP
jgi:hypothetical protein